MQLFAKHSDGKGTWRRRIEACVIRLRRLRVRLGVTVLAATFGLFVAVRPTYEVVGTLRARNGLSCLCFPPNLSPQELAKIRAGERAEFEAFARAQRLLILEDRVIHGVLNDSVIQRSAFPLINESRDPVAEIRRRLKFEISPDSDCAFVSFESTDPKEATAIVNSVTRSFVACYHDFTELHGTISKIEARVDQLRTVIREARAGLDKPSGMIAASGAEGEVAAIIDKVVSVEVELAELESAIPTIQAAVRLPHPGAGARSLSAALGSMSAASRKRRDLELREEIRREVRVDDYFNAPAEVALDRRIGALENRLANGLEPLNEVTVELAVRLRFDRVNETPMIRSANWRFLYGIVAPLGALLLVLGGHLALPPLRPRRVELRSARSYHAPSQHNDRPSGFCVQML